MRSMDSGDKGLFIRDKRHLEVDCLESVFQAGIKEVAV